MKNFVAALAMVGIMAMPAFARPSKTVAPDVPLDVIVQQQFTASSGFTIIWGDFVTTATLPQSSPSTNRGADIHVCGIETRLDALPSKNSTTQ